MPLMAYLMLRSAACPEEPPQAASRRGRVSKHAGRQCSTLLSLAASSFTCSPRERVPTPGSRSGGGGLCLARRAWLGCADLGGRRNSHGIRHVSRVSVTPGSYRERG